MRLGYARGSLLVDSMAALLIIPVVAALPAVQAHLERYPEDDRPPSAEELRDLVELAYRFVPVSEALLRYAEAVGGRPWRN